jgi:hypothetical protein
MSSVGTWALGVALAAAVAVVVAGAIGQTPAAVLLGVLVLLAAGVAAYDVIYEWLDRRRPSR